MSNVQILCVSKSHSQGGNEHITRVGGTGWNWTVEQVVDSIEKHTNTFFVADSRSGKRAEVGVVRPLGARPFIRTHADGYWNDNLLALPSCP
jgi:hypothetical protein